MRSSLPPTLGLTAFLACTLLTCSAGRSAELPQPPTPGQYTVETTSQGFARTAEVKIPQGYSAEKPPPLVLLFHGAGGDGAIALRKDGWADKADAEGFLVVAPTGLPVRPRLEASPLNNPRVWNSGQLNPRGPRAAIDDVAYTRQLLDELKEKVPYDPQRVFLAGHSNGGSMALKLAAQLSERFVAVGTVAGLVAVENPQPKRPLPALYILGTQDPLMPLEGGEVKLPWTTRQNPPVRDGLEKWAASLGCETKPQTVSDKDAVQTVVYPSKQPNGPTLTVLYLEGHGHQWPGAKIVRRNSAGGPVNTRLDATDMLWKFFQSHMP